MAKEEIKIKPFWYSDIWLFPKLITVITTLDKDGNGKLTMDELMPARGQRPGGQPGPGGQPVQGGRPDGFRPDGNGRPPAAGQGLDRPQRPARPARPE